MTARRDKPFSIRRADLLDSPGILSCLRLAFEPYREYYTPAGFSDTVLSEETVAGRFNEMSLFVAVNPQDGIVGTIACRVMERGDGHLRGMAVVPEWQGSGVAGALLAHVEAELKGLGCDRVALDTTAVLKRAARFYERNGYRTSGVVRDFFGMPLYEYGKPLL